MPQWLIFTILALFIVAFAEIGQKISLTKKEDISPQTNNCIVWFIQFLYSLLFAFYTRTLSLQNINFTTALQLVTLGIIYFFAATFFYASFKKGSASISGILATISMVTSTALGIIFFHEGTSIFKFFGAFLIFLAIVIVHFSSKEKFQKTNILALLGGLLFGVAYTIDKKFSIQLNPHTYQVLYTGTVTLVSLVFAGKQIVTESKTIHKKTLQVMFFSALAFFAWNKLNFMAYTLGGEVGKIDSINNTTIFVIILLEIIILKDKTQLKKKILTALIAGSGVFLLGFFR